MTDDKYVRSVPDPTLRTGISWYLMGMAYQMALQDVFVQLCLNDICLKDYGDEDK